MSVYSRRNEETEFLGARGRTGQALAGLCLLAAVGCLFGFLFNRETSLSYSIGYNLYGAERVLKGEVPYRDFHTLYPPATVYLNAALFKIFGVRLYTALFGVFVFKVLTTTAIYAGARQIMPQAWAILAALYSIVWLRPNGPFKAVPMHYGAFLLALALYLMLRHQRVRRLSYVVAAGISLGLLALFKHNIGGYALAGFLACLVLDGLGQRARSNRSSEGASAPDNACLVGLGAMLLGFGAPILPFVLYLAARGAAKAMIRALLFGPGEFLVSRLAGAPSPLVATICLIALAGLGYGTYRLRFWPSAAISTGAMAVAAASLFCLLGRESWVSDLLFYAPALIIAAGIGALVLRKRIAEYASAVGLLVVVAAAGFMETFPRFAREQVIAAMPFVGLLLIYLVYTAWRTLGPRMAGYKPQFVALLTVVPLAFLVLGLRFFHQTFFRGALTLRSDTELVIDRGEGVYFPAEIAGEIDRVTRYVQQQVPPGGYVFPESYAGSAFLFLADRENPSAAQFWGGVGVGQEEREATLAALDQKRVGMIISSSRDLAAEKYLPMHEYIDRNFRQTVQFDDVVILERIDR